MDPFKTVTSRAVPFNRRNVDTDIIMPAKYLKTITRTGLGQGAFEGLRYLEDGSPDPDNVFNQTQYQGAEILIVGANFGCGSSREHAAWALKDMGFRCIIGSTFADIFYSNCFKNGIVTVSLKPEEVKALMKDAETGEISVDLENQTVQRPNQEVFTFEYEPFKRHSLLNGLDEIGVTMQKGKVLEDFEAAQAKRQPWLYGAA